MLLNISKNLILNDIIGNIILIGIIISYLFQYVKIIRAKTSEGISHIFIAIGYVGTLCSLANSIIFYYPEWMNCRSFFNCDSNILGFVQLFFQSCCYICFYLLYIIYSDNTTFVYHTIKHKHIAWIIFIILTCILIGTILTSLFLIMNDHNISSSSDHIDLLDSIKIYADVLSIIIIIATCIQYIPQIIQTYKDKYPGSLSLITISIQCPGSFIIAIFLALQSAGNLSTWIPYTITGLLQLILLIMGTIFYHKNKYIMNQGYHPIILG